MRLRGIMLGLLILPRLPRLYLDGKKLRQSITRIPEAAHPIGMIRHTGDKIINAVILGESTMAGVGVDSHKRGFAGHLCKALSILTSSSVSYNVIARTGYTAEMVHKKLVNKVPEKADLIIIGLGGNDAFTLNRPSKWAESIRLLISQLRQRQGAEVPIFFTNMPPIKDFPAFTNRMQYVLGNWVEHLGLELRQLIQEYPNCYYDHRILKLEDFTNEDEVSKDKKELFSDGIHPSELTYRLWANRFAQFIASKRTLF